MTDYVNHVREALSASSLLLIFAHEGATAESFDRASAVLRSIHPDILLEYGNSAWLRRAFGPSHPVSTMLEGPLGVIIVPTDVEEGRAGVRLRIVQDLVAAADFRAVRAGDVAEEDVVLPEGATFPLYDMAAFQACGVATEVRGGRAYVASSCVACKAGRRVSGRWPDLLSLAGVFPVRKGVVPLASYSESEGLAMLPLCSRVVEPTTRRAFRVATVLSVALKGVRDRPAGAEAVAVAMDAASRLGEWARESRIAARGGLVGWMRRGRERESGAGSAEEEEEETPFK